MFLFSLTILPLFSIFLFAGLKKKTAGMGAAEFCFLQFAGIVCAAVYCVIDVFFLQGSIFYLYNFAARFFNPFFYEVLVPVLLCAALFFFFVKEPLLYKTAVFPVFLTGFYTVFLPCKLLSYGSEYPFFIILIKPLLYVFMLYNLQTCLTFFSQSFDSGKRGARFYLITAAFFLLTLMLPSFTEAVWIMNVKLPIWILPFAFSAASLFPAPKILKIKV